MITFESLGLQSSVLKAISEMGFEKPTPIQEKAIPALLTGEADLVALAQTGTGKTAAFGLPLMSMLDFTSSKTQALILCPTRELCLQISKDLLNFSKYMKGVDIVSVYGGASILNQIRELKAGAQIIVATPGRLVDLIEKKKVHLDSVEYVVLDEADEMLNMGFKEDLDFILGTTPDEKNTWLFSATMPDEVLRISRNYMFEPVEITVAKNQSNVNIEHLYYLVNNRDRYTALKRTVDFNPDIFAIIFCRTKMETQEVADALMKDGYNADALHGDLSQAQRDYVMNRYRQRSLQILVATDVAARGIDVDDVTHVINYNLPDEIEVYTHRSGRTGRAGKKGIAISLITPKEIGKVKQLERLIKTKVTKAELPSGEAVCQIQLLHIVKGLHNAEVDEKGIQNFMPAVYAEMEDLSKEEILKRFVSLEFNRFLTYYKNAPNLNVGENDRSASRGGESRGSSNKDIAKLFVNLGSMDDLDKGKLVNYIADIAGVPRNSILWIGLKDKFSFVEVRAEIAQDIITAFQTEKFNKRPVRFELRDGGLQSKESDRSSKYRSNDRDFSSRRESGRSSSFSSRDDRGGRGGNDRFAKKDDRKFGGSRDRKSSTRFR